MSRSRARCRARHSGRSRACSGGHRHDRVRRPSRSSTILQLRTRGRGASSAARRRLRRRGSRGQQGHVEPPRWSQHPRDRGQRRVEILDVHQGHVADHAVVLGAVPPIQTHGVAGHVTDSGRMQPLDLSGSLKQPFRNIDRRDRRAQRGPDSTGPTHTPGPAPDGRSGPEGTPTHARRSSAQRSGDRMMSIEISTAATEPRFSSQCIVFRSSGQPSPGPYSVVTPSRWSVMVPCRT